MTENEFRVKQSEFEGPIELLLRLVEEKKLHISRVSLAQVADDFINHLATLEDRADKSRLANFVLVAATLMLIKSLSLLPTLETTGEEQASIADLERRLALYQKVKAAGVLVRERFGERVIFARELRQSAGESTPVFSPSAELSIANLLAAARRVINALPRPEILPRLVMQKVLSLEEAISDLGRRVERALRLNFSQFVKGKKEKVNIIVSFLGMLELVKRGAISVEQSAHFGEIAIESAAPAATPRYG